MLETALFQLQVEHKSVEESSWFFDQHFKIKRSVVNTNKTLSLTSSPVFKTH